MRVGISLVLSALLAQAMYAQEVCSGSSSDPLTINNGETCTISSSKEVTSSITNKGTIILNSSSAKITFSNGGSAITIGNNGTTDRGTISVAGSGTIDASASNGEGLKIEGQDILVNEYRTLTLKATKLTLGDSDNKLTTITGNSSNVSSSSSWGVTLDTTTELDTKNVEFKNIRLTGSSLTTLKNTQSTFDNTHIISSASNGLTLSADTTPSNFTLVGESNTISAGTKALNIQGEHTFSGSGILDFVGGTITLGDGTSTKLSISSTPTTTDEEKVPTLGFRAEDKIVFKNLEASGLTLQVIRGSSNAVASNVQSTFTNGTLQAIDVNNKDQVLVIENGNSSLAKQASITINTLNDQDTVTTFKGSNVEIYGQEIEINGDGTYKNILDIQTIDAKGEIVLGKENTLDSQDGYVTIKGGTNNNKFLQLQGIDTTIGGEVTLQDLQVSTQAKNTLEDEGMIFSLSDGSTLTLNNVTLTSGIDKNYQDLSFTTLDGTSTLSISTADSSIKASSLSFDNQKIDLSNAGGKSFNLYSYGNVALDSTTGSGVGHFAFTNTTITDGNNAKLNLYSSDNAKVLASNLTLNNLTLTTYKINGSSSIKNGIDLSDSSSNLITQGSVTIDTKEFLYGSTQGIGMDITIQGGSDGNGKLTLKSDTSGDKFTFGGTLTIDNSSATNGGSNGGTSQIDIALGTASSGVQTQADSTVDWIVNGGLTAIGNANPSAISTLDASSTTTTLKAKSFTFGAGSIVSSINGTLSLSATDDSGNIDLSQALTLLQGVSSAEATISKGGGTLTLGDVIAEGKTKIENGTFSNSNITIKGLGSGADTLTIKGDTTIDGIQSIDIADANLEVKNSSNSAELQLNVDGSIISNGTSTITASTIKAENGSGGTYSVKIQNGTLTLKETTSAGDAIGSLTLGTEGKQGGNLVLMKADNDYNTLKTTKITSYQTSSITAESFDFSNGNVELSSSGGTLTLSSKSASDKTLNIRSGTVTLDNGGISYDCLNRGQNLAGIKLYDDSAPLNAPTTPTSINSKGESFIQGSSLDLKDNEITSSGGMLTLKGLSTNSTLGAVTINNNGGLTATDANGSTATDIKLSSTLTLTANAPYVSSSSPLGGGKFGVLQAKSVNFTATDTRSSLINIQVMDKSLEGEELFTLTEGGQIVVWTTEGITKGNATIKENSAITLDDISIDNGGYKSLTLSAELIPDSKTESQVNAIKVNLSVVQNNASDLTESISDNTAKEQMQTILTQGDNKEIIDSILGSSSNPLKVGFAENIVQGNVVVVGNALNYIDDTFKSVAESIHLNDRVQTQIYLSQVALVEGRMARHNNPHQSNSELISFIQSYHNTHYALSDGLLAFEESQTHHRGKGSLWASYDGGLATGNGSNSTINGISAGYDHALDSGFLVGGFVSYAYGAIDGAYLHNTSHNVGFGLYSRMVFGNNEVDLTLSQNIGLVTSDINVGNTTMPSLLNGTMEYNLYRTNVMARYGYNFKVGEEESPYYLKPLFGLNMSYTYQEGSKSNAVASITMNEASLFKLEVSAGMEMRKYINEGTYFFVMPLIERELYGNSCDMNVGFVDSANLSYTLDYQSQTSVALYAGGEGNLTENLALSGSVGVKVGIEKSEVLTNWSVGLKYKF